MMEGMVTYRKPPKAAAFLFGVRVRRKKYMLTPERPANIRAAILIPPKSPTNGDASSSIKATIQMDKKLTFRRASLLPKRY
jgi:hypothetical protein